MSFFVFEVLFCLWLLLQESTREYKRDVLYHTAKSSFSESESIYWLSVLFIMCQMIKYWWLSILCRGPTIFTVYIFIALQGGITAHVLCSDSSNGSRLCFHDYLSKKIMITASQTTFAIATEIVIRLQKWERTWQIINWSIIQVTGWFLF